MRPLLALAFALAGASGASAQVVQDRYGPPRAAQPPAQPLVLASLSAPPERGGAAYRGPLLNWSSKLAAKPREASLRPSPEPAARRPLPAASGSGPGPADRPAPPDSLYAPPAPRPAKIMGPEAARPAAVALAQPSPWAAPEPTRSAPIAATQPFRSVAAAAPPPATAPAAPQQLATLAPAPRAGGAAPRYYSLHREYGLTPDAIPEQSAQPRYVLIGPPDAARPPADQDRGDGQTPNERGAF